MTADQILSTDFMAQLSGAIDRYYNGDVGAFEQGYEHFHNAAGQATLVAVAAEELGLPTRIVGIDELPEHTTHPEGPGAGYDWAVVDNRWVVDLWRLSYHGMNNEVILDMKDPAGAAAVERLFGSPDTWEELATDPNEIEIARKIWNNLTLPYKAVDDLLGGLPER